MRSRWSLGTYVVISGLTLSAPGCSSDTRTGVPAAAPPPASSIDINARPRNRVQDGGSFTWPLQSMPVNFNYHEIDGTAMDNAYVIGALMPSLIATDAAGTPVWDMNYLASEPTLATEPQQVVTYRLNPKATWDDGTPITWEDLFWQWKANNGMDPAYRIASANGYENIERVEQGTDSTEVVVTFKEKYADWQGIFSPFYPASTNKNAETFNDGWRNRPLVTAGPFKLANINPTAKTITVERNEKWWGEPAKLDTIVFRVIESDAQIDALANHEIDAMDIGPDASTYERAKAITDVDVRVAGGPNFRHLTINGAAPHLQDVRVRRALAAGINRSVIARAMLGPLNRTPQVLNNHIFMANQYGYRDTSNDIGRHDPERAKQLLDEAGWLPDGDVRRKDGTALTIRLVIPSGVQASRQESELIQNMLGQLGVTVTIDTVPTDDFFDKYITPGQFDFTVFSWMGTPFPISSSRSLYVMPTINAQGQLDIEQNYARIGSEAIDHLLAQAAQEFDRDKAIDLANQADELIWREVHSLTLYQRPELIASRRHLANFGAFGFASWVYQDIGWEKEEDQDATSDQ